MSRISLKELMIVTTALLALHHCWANAGRIFNEGTNYEVDEDDIVTYVELGKPCDPKVQNDNKRKDGICRATLYCNPTTKLCDCEDLGPYVYTEERGKCKNIVGSACYKSENCVQGAACKSGKCQCNPNQSCLKEKKNVQRL